jgi:hypothetical protein
VGQAVSVTMPDFLILGAARSATTSLHYYLEQHPGVSMSTIKEPNHFAFDHDVDPPAPLIDPASPIVTKSVPDRASYERLFAHAGEGDVVGEASPLYLYVRETPAQIRRAVPGARLVAVVRHPVDRAYSHWLHIRREGADAAVEKFRSDCEVEMAGGGRYSPYAGASHVLRMGLYDEQLERYLEEFGPEPLLVLAYEDLVADPLTSLHALCDHLGVDRHDFRTDVQYNPSGVTGGRARAAVTRVVRSTQPTLKAVLPRSVAARLGRLRATFDRPAAAPPIPGDLRRELVSWFAPSVERLRSLQVVDVDGWEDFA